MGTLDIKSLTRELKLAASDPSSTSGEKAQPVVKKDTIKPAKAKPGNLDTIFAEVARQQEYNTNACVYIDSEIHDVLRLLKTRTKLRIGPFISWILEGFINEHKGEIAKLLKRKTNRFIDR